MRLQSSIFSIFAFVLGASACNTDIVILPPKKLHEKKHSIEKKRILLLDDASFIELASCDEKDFPLIEDLKFGHAVIESDGQCYLTDLAETELDLTKIAVGMEFDSSDDESSRRYRIKMKWKQNE